MQLSGGWERDERDRSYQEIDNSTEDCGQLHQRMSLFAWLGFDARDGAAEREADPYVAVPRAGAPQNPLLRKFNRANRACEFCELWVQLFLPGNAALSLGGFERKDNDVNSVFAFFSRQEIGSRQNDSQSFGSPDWVAGNVDRFETASIGLRLNDLNDPWNAQFEHSDAHDWALDGVEPDILQAILASGTEAYDYNANLIGCHSAIVSAAAPAPRRRPSGTEPAGLSGRS